MRVVSLADKKNKQNDKYFERCVLCGNLTNVPRNLHIDFRANYIEGVGQLCPHCAEK